MSSFRSNVSFKYGNKYGPWLHTFFSPMFCIFVLQLRVKYNYSHVSAAAEGGKKRNTLSINSEGLSSTKWRRAKYLHHFGGRISPCCQGARPLQTDCHADGMETRLSKAIFTYNAQKKIFDQIHIDTIILNYLLRRLIVTLKQKNKSQFKKEFITANLLDVLPEVFVLNNSELTFVKKGNILEAQKKFKQTLNA